MSSCDLSLDRIGFPSCGNWACIKPMEVFLTCFFDKTFSAKMGFSLPSFENLASCKRRDLKQYAVT